MRLAYSLVSLIAFGFILWIGKTLILPLVIALLLCVVFQPLIARLQKRGIPWGVTVAGVMAVMLAVLWFAGAALFKDARDYLMSLEVPAAVGESHEPAPVVGPFAAGETRTADERSLAGLIDEVQAFVDGIVAGKSPAELFDELGATLKKAVSKTIVLLIGGLGAAGGMLFGILTVLLFMLFIFAEQNSSLKKIAAAAGPRAAEVREIMSRIATEVNRFLAAKACISLGTAVFCYVPMQLLGVPYAPLFALLTFFLDFVPAFGSILAGAFPVVAAWARTGSFKVPLILIGVYIAANMLFGSFLEPRILGKQLNLSPLVILIAVLFWASLWGVAGMFLAVPLTRSLQLVFANIPSTRPVAILMSNGDAIDPPPARA